jgi:hypothetical protein
MTDWLYSPSNACMHKDQCLAEINRLRLALACIAGGHYPGQDVEAFASQVLDAKPAERPIRCDYCDDLGPGVDANCPQCGRPRR